MKHSKYFQVAVLITSAMALSAPALANSNHAAPQASYNLQPPTLANVSVVSHHSGYRLGENLPYQFKRGMHHFEMGNYDSASKAFNRVLRDSPRDPMSNYYMGLTKQYQGNHKKAIKHLGYINRIFQASPQVYAALGKSLVAVGDYDAANTLLSDLETMERECSETCKTDTDIKTAKSILKTALGS